MSLRQMLTARRAILAVAACLGLFAGFAARAAEPAPPGVGNEALDALGRMSKTLQAQQFSFTSHSLRAYAGPNGELLHIVHTSKVAYRRPDRLAVDVIGDDGSVKLIYDGKAVILYGIEAKHYASLPVTGGIDKALDAIEERTGTDFPLADLLSTDPGKSLLSGVTSGGQVGTATIDGVSCRHFFFVQAAEDLELELWLEDNDRALPRRVIATYRSLPGRPIFMAELSDWNLNPQAPDSLFEFKPPAGVSQVEFGARPGAAPPK